MNDNHELYNREVISALDRLAIDNSRVASFKYFEDIVFEHAISEVSPIRQPQVVVLGACVPEAILRAFDIEYFYLWGGSHTETLWSDDLVPRDTDPVTRAVLGAIHAPDGMSLHKALFIIPTGSDSMRKIAYILKEEGFKTFSLDIPPDHTDRRCVDKWEEQLKNMVEAISKHTRKPLSLRKLKKTIKSLSLAHYQLSTFMRNSANSFNDISGAGKMLIRNSCYWADNLSEWRRHLNSLNKEVLSPASGYRPENRPKILLTGSPVVFPNYKIPFLIEESGLVISDYIDASTIKQAEILTPDRFKSIKDAIRYIAASSYKHEASQGFTGNAALMSAICQCLNRDRVEGVIFHILKGQIEYDFELERMSEMFEHFDVPVFRLETDYQKQDVEQLRIRLEAFREMLSQTHFISDKKAV